MSAHILSTSQLRISAMRNSTFTEIISGALIWSCIRGAIVFYTDLANSMDCFTLGIPAIQTSQRSSFLSPIDHPFILYLRRRKEFGSNYLTVSSVSDFSVESFHSGVVHIHFQLGVSNMCRSISEKEIV